jgi:hypothetical protein
MLAWQYIRHEGGLLTSFDSTTYYPEQVTIRQSSLYARDPLNRKKITTSIAKSATPYDDMSAVALREFFNAGSIVQTPRLPSNSDEKNSRKQYQQTQAPPQQSVHKSIFSAKSNRSLGKTSSHPVQLGPWEQEEPPARAYMSNEPPVPPQPQPNLCGLGPYESDSDGSGPQVGAL